MSVKHGVNFQLVPGRDPQSQLPADTAHMPKGVPREKFKYQNNSKLLKIITVELSGVFFYPLNMQKHTLNKAPANIVQETLEY